MTNMERARQAGLLGGPSTVFAHNLLEIAVAPGNPKRVTTLKDLARPDVTLVLAAPEVPAGRYAAQALARAHVDAKPRSLETDVESVLAKVELGEADAGVVYATDVRAAGSRVQGVAIPPAENIVAAYPAAELKKAPNPSGARAFLAYLEAPEARQVLQRYGFQPG
jgi:molybdate transport system substrate-binding protein